EEQPGGGAAEDDKGFLDLEAPEQPEAAHGDDRGGDVDDGLPGEYDGGAGDGPGGGGRGAFDEGLDLSVVAVAEEPRAGDDHAEVDRGEDGDGSGDRAREASDEVADEPGGDHDRARGDETHGHGVEELPFGQPVVLVDHAFPQEGDDGQPAPENEGPGL